MPCRDDRTCASENLAILRERLQRVEPLLCEAVDLLEKNNLLRKVSKELMHVALWG